MARIAIMMVVALGAAVWIAVAGGPGAQDELPAAPVFKMRAGSGEIPQGSVEIVSAGRRASMRTREGRTIGLASLVDRMVDQADGASFSGPLEVAVRGGVSFYVPGGAEMQLSQRADGGVLMQALLGGVFARNVRATLRVDAPGSMLVTAEGRFGDLRGRAEAARGGAHATVEREAAGTPSKDLVLPPATDVPPTVGAVSPSKPAR